MALASPLDAVAVNAAHSTAVMVAPFAGVRGFEALLADARRRAVALGPGAGADRRRAARDGGADPAARPAPVVLDADALTSFAGEAETLAGLIARGGQR